MNFDFVITGADGYIGSHMAYRLLKKGHSVIGIDFKCTANTEKLYENFREYDFILSDIKDIKKLPKCKTLLHFAAHKSVPKSNLHAEEYYRNNIFAFIDFIENTNIKWQHIILSSSAGVYTPSYSVSPLGEGYHIEGELTIPQHPYGISKLILEEFLKYKNISHTSLRYFNPMGSSDLVTEIFDKSSENLLPKLLYAYHQKDTFHITGTDYDTKDGTCIRDFIHVEDLIDAHEMFCIDSFNGVYNVGTGHGYTVKQVVDAFKKVNSINLKVEYAPRRIGDPAILLADTSKIAKLGFRCTRTLDDMVRLPASLNAV